MTARTRDAYPIDDTEVAPFIADLGLDGILDVHVHAMPDRLQQAVWDYFDGLSDPPWPVTYRSELAERLATLRALGVRRHTALAYAHKPGMLDWLNDFTMVLADEHDQVVPTFTLYPEEGVAEQVACRLDAGGAVVKVHLQVGRFHATDPRLTEAWQLLEAARTPIVLHASAVYGVTGGAEYCGADEVRELLERHPDLVVVVAHLGMPQFDEFLALAESTPGLLLDTAMVPTDPPYAGAAYPRGFEERVWGLRSQLLFGSDFPTIPHAYAAQVRGLAVLELDDAELRAVLHDRAAGLLDAVRGR